MDNGIITTYTIYTCFIKNPSKHFEHIGLWEAIELITPIGFCIADSKRLFWGEYDKTVWHI